MISNAVLDSAKNRIVPNKAELETLKNALIHFHPPDEDDLLEGDTDAYSNAVRLHPDKNIENFFAYVTKAGKPCFEWEIIRPAFLWKLKHCLHEMVRIDQMRCDSQMNFKNSLHRPDLSDTDSELRQTYDFIMKKAEDLDGTPFTLQRLCELLDSPQKHYSRADKYFRAVDKCVNVVSTITPEGRRVTGVEEFIIPANEPARIEQRFFGKVDELDDDDLWEPSTLAKQFCGPHVPTVKPEESNEKPLDMTQKKAENADKIIDDEKEKKDSESQLVDIPMDLSKSAVNGTSLVENADKENSAETETAKEAMEESTDDVKPTVSDPSTCEGEKPEAVEKTVQDTVDDVREEETCEGEPPAKIKREDDESSLKMETEEVGGAGESTETVESESGDMKPETVVDTDSTAVLEQVTEPSADSVPTEPATGDEEQGVKMEE